MCFVVVVVGDGKLWVFFLGACVLIIVHGRSRMTIDPRIAAIPGQSTPGFHRPGKASLGSTTRGDVLFVCGVGGGGGRKSFVACIESFGH